MVFTMRTWCGFWKKTQVSMEIPLRLGFHEFLSLKLIHDKSLAITQLLFKHSYQMLASEQFVLLGWCISLRWAVSLVSREVISLLTSIFS